MCLRYGRHHRRSHLGCRGQCGRLCACRVFLGPTSPVVPPSEPSSAGGSSASSVEGRSDLLQRIKALQDAQKALKDQKKKCAQEIKKRHEAELFGCRPRRASSATRTWWRCCACARRRGGRVARFRLLHHHPLSLSRMHGFFWRPEGRRPWVRA